MHSFLEPSEGAWGHLDVSLPAPQTPLLKAVLFCALSTDPDPLPPVVPWGGMRSLPQALENVGKPNEGQGTASMP